MSPLSSSEQLLLRLLREVLWSQGAPVDAPYPDLPTCQATYALAKKQAVEGIIDKRLSEMMAQAGATQELLLQHAQRKWTIVRTNQHVDQVVIKVVNALQQSNIGYVMVKGQGVARHYPTPQLRKPGDIDLSVGTANYQAAIDALLPLAQTEVSEEDKHASLVVDGIDIEIHHSVISQRHTADGRRLQQWAARALAPECSRTIQVAGVNVEIPSENAESMYIFYHAWHHLFHHSGVGLRQLIDWMLTLHDDHAAIDVDKLEALLRKVHLLNDWQTFAALLVRHLGMPAEEVPLYQTGRERRADHLLRIVMQRGNHGEQGYAELLAHRPKSRLRGRLYTMQRFLRLYADLYHVAPRSARNSIAMYLKKGCRHHD